MIRWEGKISLNPVGAVILIVQTLNLVPSPIVLKFMVDGFSYLLTGQSYSLASKICQIWDQVFHQNMNFQGCGHIQRLVEKSKLIQQDTYISFEVITKAGINKSVHCLQSARYSYDLIIIHNIF